MSHRRILLALVLVPACAAPRGAAQVRAVPPAVAIPQATWTETYLPIYDSMTTAAGLPSLRAAAPTRAQREARIWIHGPGDDVELFRFVEDRGIVFGEALLAWEISPMETAADGSSAIDWHELAVFRARGPCSEFFRTSGVGGCRAKFATSPDWAKVLRRLQSAGLWDLPDESTLPSREIVFDGFSITVELRSTTGYRIYHYGNPSMQRWPEDNRAAELMRIVRELSGQLLPRESIRAYRGHVGGPGRSEFRPCGSAEVWQINQHALRSAAQPLGLALPVVARNDSAPPLYVEVTGELAPTWLARYWGSTNEHVLSILGASVVRSWSEGSC